MPGDATNKNEDELLDQIDDLKARMDRLMSGGSSTSNSALLTDKALAAPPPVEPPPVAPPPAPDRPRVRDLVDTEDTEVIEVYPGPKEVVPFPDKGKPASDEADPVDHQPVARSAPAPGSVITVEEDQKEERPQVATFDDLGNAIQQELARDGSIPPAEAKRGPDLASRFGPVDRAADPDSTIAEPAEDEEPDSPEPEDEIDEISEEPEVELEDPPEVMSGGNVFGKVAVVWIVTAVASGAIATLHFTGII